MVCSLIRALPFAADQCISILYARRSRRSSIGWATRRRSARGPRTARARQLADSRDAHAPGAGSSHPATEANPSLINPRSFSWGRAPAVFGFKRVNPFKPFKF